MPYIPAPARADLDPAIDALNELLLDRTGGAFNYVISRLAGARVLAAARQAAARNVLMDSSGRPIPDDEVLAWIEEEQANATAGYEARAETLGHLTAATAEFQRRVLDDYEAAKRSSLRDDMDVPEYAELRS